MLEMRKWEEQQEEEEEEKEGERGWFVIGVISNCHHRAAGLIN